MFRFANAWLNCFCVTSQDFFSLVSKVRNIPVFTRGGIRVQRPERALNLSHKLWWRWKKKSSYSVRGRGDGSLTHKHASKIRQRGWEKQLFLIGKKRPRRPWLIKHSISMIYAVFSSNILLFVALEFNICLSLPWIFPFTPLSIFIKSSQLQNKNGSLLQVYFSNF